MRKLFFTLIISCGYLFSFAQTDLKTFIGAGYSSETKIGFRGVSFHLEEQINFSAHFNGIVGLNYFTSNSVPKWSSAENQGVYYHQFMGEAKAQYFGGEEPGTGFLAGIGLAYRTGSTYHFESGDLKGGTFSNQQYMKEKLLGNGILLNIGYGFQINENLRGKIEFNDYSMRKLNEIYQLSLKVGF
ncbi:MAG: hypothetical protein C5B52_13170 [Bacteroidetes bacterium]|nr:MAG: hypothetical protein C5B52_13170 [Bacteroidota bacterium]